MIVGASHPRGLNGAHTWWRIIEPSAPCCWRGIATSLDNPRAPVKPTLSYATAFVYINLLSVIMMLFQQRIARSVALTRSNDGSSFSFFVSFFISSLFVLKRVVLNAVFRKGVCITLGVILRSMSWWVFTA